MYVEAGAWGFIGVFTLESFTQYPSRLLTKPLVLLMTKNGTELRRAGLLWLVNYGSFFNPTWNFLSYSSHQLPLGVHLEKLTGSCR